MGNAAKRAEYRYALIFAVKSTASSSRADDVPRVDGVDASLCLIWSLYVAYLGVLHRMRRAQRCWVRERRVIGCLEGD